MKQSLLCHFITLHIYIAAVIDCFTCCCWLVPRIPNYPNVDLIALTDSNAYPHCTFDRVNLNSFPSNNFIFNSLAYRSIVDVLGSDNSNNGGIRLSVQNFYSSLILVLWESPPGQRWDWTMEIPNMSNCIRIIRRLTNMEKIWHCALEWSN